MSEEKEDLLNMIRIYLYNNDLKNKIRISQNINKESNENIEKYIFKDKCFLINKEYLDSYKNHYLFTELEKHLDELIKKMVILNMIPMVIYIYQKILILYMKY